jgi:hypothetical protein
MECYRFYGQTCQCWCLPIPDTSRRVCADQEDGVVEVAFVKKWGWGKLKR